MEMITAFHVNSSPQVSATALLALGREVYAEKGFDAAYRLVYTMFDGLHTSELVSILEGETKAHVTSKGFFVFLEDYANG